MADEDVADEDVRRAVSALWAKDWDSPQDSIFDRSPYRPVAITLHIRDLVQHVDEVAVLAESIAVQQARAVMAPRPDPAVQRALAVTRLRLAAEAAGEVLAVRLLELHQPHRVDVGGWPPCDGCEYTDEPVEWPCVTVELVAEHLGVELA